MQPDFVFLLFVTISAIFGSMALWAHRRGQLERLAKVRVKR